MKYDDDNFAAGLNDAWNHINNSNQACLIPGKNIDLSKLLISQLIECARFLLNGFQLASVTNTATKELDFLRGKFLRHRIQSLLQYNPNCEAFECCDKLSRMPPHSPIDLIGYLDNNILAPWA